MLSTRPFLQGDIRFETLLAALHGLPMRLGYFEDYHGQTRVQDLAFEIANTEDGR
jgi:hypothetical protein